MLGKVVSLETEGADPISIGIVNHREGVKNGAAHSATQWSIWEDRASGNGLKWSV